MKIVSPFRDYYDNVVQYGADRETLYLRKTPEEVQYEQTFIPGRDIWTKIPRLETSFEKIQIGRWDSDFLVRVGSKRFYVRQWSLDFLQFDRNEKCDDKCAGLDVKVLDRKKGRFTVTSPHLYERYRCQAVETDSDFRVDQINPIEVFDISLCNTTSKFSTSVIRIPNVKLEALRIHTVLHTYEAYQEIYTWLCNHTNPEKPMVNVDNDVRIQQHGFDLKTSFRKGKTKK